MDRFLLVINSGSSSIKFAVFYIPLNTASPKVWCRGALQLIDTEPCLNLEVSPFDVTVTRFSETLKFLPITNMAQAHTGLARWLISFIKPSSISMVCYRIVHGGERYNEPVVIEGNVYRDLKSLIPLAPIHQHLGLDAIEVFRKHFPDAIHKACFDTAFHHRMPKVAQTFAIPQSLTVQGIRPYGFHGLSYQYIVTMLAEINHGQLPQRMIVAHLGSGASLCAILNGESIDTTMTFSPLDGLPMATRCGAIDANAVLYMASELGMSVDEISTLLNKKSGLLGLSGVSGDVRFLLKDKSDSSVFALRFYCYRICRELSGLTGLLKGLDAVVFTGGVGAHCWQIRRRVCQQFDWLAVSLNSAANRKNEILISAPKSKIKVFAIKTDEEIMMARLAFGNGFYSG